MNPSTSPYDAAIEEIEARIQEFQKALDTLRQLRAQSEGVPFVAATRSNAGSGVELSHDAFFGMTIAEAAKKYLSIVKQTKSTAEIATALVAGGLKHSSKDFGTTIRSILSPRHDEFTRVNTEWGLKEWYPGKGRGRKPKSDKPARAMRAKKSPQVPGASKPSGPLPPKKHGVDPQSIKARVLKFLNINPAKTFSAPEIAEHVHGAAPSVAAALSVLLKNESITRPETGRYQAKAA